MHSNQPSMESLMLSGEPDFIRGVFSVLRLCSNCDIVLCHQNPSQPLGFCENSSLLDVPASHYEIPVPFVFAHVTCYLFTWHIH